MNSVHLLPIAIVVEVVDGAAVEEWIVAVVVAVVEVAVAVERVAFEAFVVVATVVGFEIDPEDDC